MQKYRKNFSFLFCLYDWLNVPFFTPLLISVNARGLSLIALIYTVIMVKLLLETMLGHIC